MKNIVFLLVCLFTLYSTGASASTTDTVNASPYGTFYDLFKVKNGLLKQGVVLRESLANIIELRFKMIKTENGVRKSFPSKKGDRFLFDAENIFFESNGVIVMSYAINTKETVFEADLSAFKYRETKAITLPAAATATIHIAQKSIVKSTRIQQETTQTNHTAIATSTIDTCTDAHIDTCALQTSEPSPLFTVIQRQNTKSFLWDSLMNLPKSQQNHRMTDAEIEQAVNELAAKREADENSIFKNMRPAPRDSLKAPPIVGTILENSE